MSVGRYWILTIPKDQYTPILHTDVIYTKGQLECGEGGFLHWQLIAVFNKNVRLSAVTKLYGPYHAELTKSDKAMDYVWKDDTSVADTRFELGKLPLKRNSKTDWEAVWNSAKTNKIEDIDYNIRFQHYRTIKQITKDYLIPQSIEREVFVFWGRTATGKSRRAWEEAGLEAYPKDPRTKFWDGYQGHKHVVMDEFRGSIDIAHLLRWFDRYPVIVEQKCTATTLCATKIWITSNLDPRQWFPDIDELTRDALLRRLTITHFQ